MSDCSCGGLAVVGGACEGFEVFFADEECGGFFHCVGVEVAGSVPAVSYVHDGADGCGVDHVAVELGFGVGDCVEIFADVDGFEDGDVVGEDVVQGFDEVGSRDWGVDVEVCYLAEGVDACVGSGGAGDFDWCVAELGDGGFDCFLDGWETGLSLPAVISCAVVCDFDFYSSC